MNQHMKHKNCKLLCYCCNELTEKGEDLIKFVVKDRGYQSFFHDCDFEIQLHLECAVSLGIENEWFDNDLCFNEEDGSYKNEQYIINLIETFIVENQEYIYNSDKFLTRNEWIEQFS